MLKYPWECGHCKLCSICSESKKDDPELLLCDSCDRGFHTYCITASDAAFDKNLDEWLCADCLKGTNAKLKKKANVIKRRSSVSSKKTRDVGTSGRSESAKKVYFGGKLSQRQADVTKTTPTLIDEELFEKSIEDSKKTSPPVLEPYEEKGKVVLPRIRRIVINGYEIDTWYIAPYPEEYNTHEYLYLCQYCLKYMKSPFIMERHKSKCYLTSPPGDEIYRDGDISIFEVDGRKNKIYCQNLCLLAKMFLDHKTLYYDVEPFLFYVLTEWSDKGCAFVGYFSKEKRTSSDYNLSCIITLPCFQGKGYGQTLIDFSYLLSRREGKTGSPEKPLSDLGLITYRSYWRTILLKYLQSRTETTVSTVSKETGMTTNDVVMMLQELSMLKKAESGDFVIVIDKEKIDNYVKKLDSVSFKCVDAKKLRWIPFETKLSAV